jgi:uncharacterized protein (UPF0332 family)
MSVSESQRYLDRPYLDLQAARSNLQQGFYGVAITRAYYAMFYVSLTVLSSISERQVNCERTSPSGSLD